MHIVHTLYGDGTTENVHRSSVQPRASNDGPHALIPEKMKHSLVFSPVLLVARRGELKINIGTLSRKDPLYSPTIYPEWDPLPESVQKVT